MKQRAGDLYYSISYEDYKKHYKEDYEEEEK